MCVYVCFASFYYLVFHSILFHYIHAFIWVSCAPLIIIDHVFMSLGWSFLASCTLCQSWQKGGEIVETLWFFFFKILHVRGRNTFFCKGEMCFILLGGVLTSFFLYIGLVTIFWHTLYLSSLYVDVCFFHLPLHVLFLFYLYTQVSYILYAIYYLCFTLRWLDEFCLKCSRNTGCQSLLAINSLLAKFFKSLF